MAAATSRRRVSRRRHAQVRRRPWRLARGQAIGVYIVDRHIRGASNAYGTFAVVIGLLTWLYLGAQLTMIAAVVRCRRLWPRSLLPAPTRPEDEQALSLQARQEEVSPPERIFARFRRRPERAIPRSLRRTRTAARFDS